MKFNWTSIPTILASILPLVASLSIPLQPRAGAPIPVSITDCTTSNPLLCTSAAYCPPVSYEPFRPTTSTLQPPPPDSTGALLYAYYLQPSDGLVTSGNDSTLFQRCLETCAGYGSPNSCQAVYQARNYPAPPMFGAPGGELTVACLLFGRAITVEDFEVVPEQERTNWTMPQTANLECPS
jgi:hypothetical protein